MWMKHPEIARKWSHEYPGQKNLPMHAHETPRQKIARALMERKVEAASEN